MAFNTSTILNKKNMKGFIISFQFLFIFNVPSHAQIASEANSYRRGDKVERLQVAYMPLEENGQRAVLNFAGTVGQVNDYYPSGVSFPQSTSTISNSYKFCGKELDRMNGMDWYDSEARFLDVTAGARFTTPDPKAWDYPEVSPYAYCMNNPVNAVDPDGELILFINGKIGFGSPQEGEPYWNGRFSSFVLGATRYFSDTNINFIHQDYELTSSARKRFTDGYNYAKTNLKLLVASLNENEKINMVTHSMGAAFAEGMASYLYKKGYTIGELVHINAFQAADIQTIDPNSNEVITTDYQNTNDWVINDIPFFAKPGQIKGADYRIREKSEDNNFMTRHRSPIDSQGSKFWDELEKKRINSSFVDSKIKILK